MNNNAKRFLSGLLCFTLSFGATGPTYADLVYKKLVKQLIVSDSQGGPTGTPAGTLSSTALSFGSLPVGQSSKQSVRFTSTGTAALHFYSAPAISGNAAYTSSSNCSGDLSPGSYCDTEITYAPTGISTTPAVVSFATNAGTKTVDLTGSGLLGLAALAASSNTAFGSVSVGSIASRSFVFSNTGNIAINSLVVSLTGAGLSIASSTCGTSLNAASNCSFVVDYSPTAVGNLSGTVSVASSASNGTQSLSLTGSATAAPAAAVTLSKSAISFSALPGSTDTSTVRLSNTGNAPLTFTAAPSTSGNAAYSATTNCATTLAAGAFCDTTVTFAPSATGAFSGNLNFATDVGTHTVSLSGTGEPPMTVSVSGALQDVQSLNSNMGTVSVGSSSSKPVYLLVSGNSGTLATTASITGANASDFVLVSAHKYLISYAGEYWPSIADCGAAVSAQSSTTCTADHFYSYDHDSMRAHERYVVKFQPTSSGAKAATLSINHNGANTSPITINLTGFATATPVIALSTSTLNFGTVNVGGTAEQTIRVTNAGTGILTFNTEPSVTGSAYSISNSSCSTSLAVGAYCDITVRFAPTSGASATGALSLLTNADSSPDAVTLSGTGAQATASLAAANGSSADFGSVAVLGSKSNTFTLSNTGNAAMTVTGVSATGTDVSVTATTCTGALAAGANCSITVVFAPTTATTMSGNLTVTSSAANSPTSLAISGTSAGAAEASLSTTSVAFGAVAVNTTTSAQSVRLTNAGNVAMTLTAAPALTGSTSFVSLSTNCGATLAAGAYCDTSVQFAPTSNAAVSGTITFYTDVGNSTVSLSGSGLSAVGVLSIPTGSSNFGTITVGGTKQQSFAFTNNGNITATNVVASVTGTDVSITYNACGSSGAPGSLLVGTSCVFTVTYAPTVAGSLNGSVSVASSAVNGTQSLSITGTATEVAVADWSASSLAFGTVAVGSSYTMSVRMINSGGSDLSISAPPVLGTGSSIRFGSLSTNCGSTLTPGQYCDTSVTFTPADLSSVTGAIEFATSASNKVIPLTGSGSGAQMTLAASTSTDFGSVSVGANASRTFTISNPGNTSLQGVWVDLTSGQSAGISSNTCGISSTPVTLMAGQSCSVSVTYAPTQTGSLSVVLMAHNTNAYSGTSSTLTLTGTAVTSHTYVNPTALLWDQSNNITAVNSSKAQTFQVANDGGANVTLSAVTLRAGSSSTFAVTGNNCVLPVVLTAGNAKTCTITVTFSPTATTTESGFIDLTTSAGETVNVQLTGTGQRAVGALAAASGYSTNFGTVNVGATSDQMFTFTNSGVVSATGAYVSVTGSGLSLPANTCGTQATPVSVAAGGTCSVTVRYTPTAAGTSLSSASLSVISSASNSPNALSLTGTAGNVTPVLDVNFANGPVNAANGNSLTANGLVSVNYERGYASGFSDTNYFSGSTTVSNIAVGAAGDFTEEAWVYLPATPSTYYTLVRGDSAGSIDSGIAASSIKYQIQPGNNAVQWTGITWPTQQWVHIAMVRQSGVSTFYLNGVATGGTKTDTTDSFSASAFRIGANSVAGYSFGGQIGSVRITKQAMYTANFTPTGAPSGVPVADANYGSTSMLVHADGSFAESKAGLATGVANNITFSTDKYAGSKAFNFVPTSSASTTSELSYSNSTGAFTIGTSAFTVEMWIKPRAYSSEGLYGKTLFDTRADGSNSTNNAVMVGMSKEGYLTLSRINAGASELIAASTSTIPLNQWSHVAWSRTGGTSYLFINGTVVASAADSLNYQTPAGNVKFGTNAHRATGPTTSFDGLIDEIRVTKGLGRYSSNFTPQVGAFPNQ